MNDNLKNYTVNIFGSCYPVVSDESLESILEAASLVDSMMQGVAQKSPLLPVHVIAVLVALQLSHKQQITQQESKNYDQLCKTLVNKADECLHLCFDTQ